MRLFSESHQAFINFPDDTPPEEIQVVMKGPAAATGNPLPALPGGALERAQNLATMLRAEEPVKTPFGSILDYFNINREQLVNRLATAKLSLGRHPYPLPSSDPAIEEKMGRLAANLVLPPAAIRPSEAAIASQIRPVYHGSPHQFEKFQSSAIGSGEGAQTFGWGHYFSESPAIAQFYAEKTLKNPLQNIGWKVGKKILKEPEVQFPWVLNRYANGQSKETILKELSESENLLQAQKVLFPKDLDLQKAIQHAKESKKFAQTINEKVEFWAEERPLPRIYEATLHKGKKPGEYQYLEWEKLVDSKLLEHLKTTAAEIYSSPKARTIAKELNRIMTISTGERVYRLLTSLLEGGQQETSRFLQKAGLSGIKYPSGTLSDVQGSTIRNYVVFDPADITIDVIK